MQRTTDKKSEFRHIIDGKRIYLRKVRRTDVTDQYHRWMNDPEINQFLETRFAPQSLDDIASYVRKITADPHSIFMAIMLRDDDLHIGNIKIGPVNQHHHFADISLLIGEKTCWGKGYATEAIRLAATYGFNTLNLHKITAGIYGNNTASIRAFKKAGFIEEGRRKNHRFYQGIYVDEVLMGMSC